MKWKLRAKVFKLDPSRGGFHEGSPPFGKFSKNFTTTRAKQLGLNIVNRIDGLETH
jgi:hypothetical protein